MSTLRTRHPLTLALLTSCALALALSVVRNASSEAQSATLPDSQEAAADWSARLAALKPEQPLEYFLLAEEIADAAQSESQRGLARQLFGLAGVLDPKRLGRSSALALADLAVDPMAKRRLLALGWLLDDRVGGDALGRRPEALAEPAAALAVSEALSHFRKGLGPRALAALKEPGATELFARHPHVLHEPVERFMEELRQYHGQAKPRLSPRDLLRMLQFEAALLAGGERSWSSDLLLSADRPLAEVDPDRIDQMLGMDPSRPYYRDGAWVARP
jgi:hypothetical protein